MLMDYIFCLITFVPVGFWLGQKSDNGLMNTYMGYPGLKSGVIHNMVHLRGPKSSAEVRGNSYVRLSNFCRVCRI